MYGELEEVLRHIPQKIEETEIITLYRELATLYEQARNEPNAETTTNIQKKIEEVIDAQVKIQPQNWDSVKMKAFEKLGAMELLGIDGSDSFVKELGSYSNDPHGVSELCNRWAADIENLKKRVEQAVNSLESLFADEESLPKGKRRIEIVFDKDVAVDRFGDMATQAREWDLILKTLKLTVPNSPGDGQVWRIYKINPTTIIFIIPVEQASSMLSIVADALGIIASLLTLKLLMSQTQRTPLPAEEKEGISTLIQDAEKKQLAQAIDESVEGLVKDSGLTGTERNVAKTSFTYILKRVYNFFAEGGTVNPLDSVKDQKENKRIENFSLKFQEIVHTLKTKKETLLLAEFSPKEKKELKEVVKVKSTDKLIERIQKKVGKRITSTEVKIEDRKGSRSSGKS